MRLIITGCEYSGTTTLASGVCKWAEGVMGGRFTFHDHWKIPDLACYPERGPSPGLTEDECQEILVLSPKLKEMLQRQSLIMHIATASEGHDHMFVGFHLDDAVYAPLYFGYGGEDEPQGGPRTRYARYLETQLLKSAPDVTLVLVKASSEVIAARMGASPHRRGVLREADIDYVLRRFDEEFQASLIGRKLTLDTSEATPDETLGRFVEQIKPHLSETDRLGIMAHRALLQDQQPAPGNGEQ